MKIISLPGREEVMSCVSFLMHCVSVVICMSMRVIKAFVVWRQTVVVRLHLKLMNSVYVK